MCVSIHYVDNVHNMRYVNISSWALLNNCRWRGRNKMTRWLKQHDGNMAFMCVSRINVQKVTVSSSVHTVLMFSSFSFNFSSQWKTFKSRASCTSCSEMLNCVNICRASNYFLHIHPTPSPSTSEQQPGQSCTIHIDLGMNRPYHSMSLPMSKCCWIGPAISF